MAAWLGGVAGFVGLRRENSPRRFHVHSAHVSSRVKSYSRSQLSTPRSEVSTPRSEALDVSFPSFDASFPSLHTSLPSLDASFPSPDTSFPSLDTSFRSSRRLVPKSRQLSWRAREVRRRHITPFAVNTMHTGMEVIDVVKGGRCVYLSKTCKNNPSRPRAVRGVEMVRRMGRGGGASAFFLLFFVN